MSSKNICKFITPSIPYTLSISCFVLESDPAIMRAPSTLPDHRLILVLQGEGVLTLDSSTLRVRAGSLVLAMRGEVMSIVPSDDFNYIYIAFDGARADELFRRFAISPFNRHFDGYDGLIPLWRDSLSRADEQTVDLAAEGMLLYTFSRISIKASEQGELISRVIAISEEGFADPDLTITAIADELGYNAKYLSHAFKSRMGMGYSEYLRSIRIKYAVSLFDHGIDSIKNVALLSGFADPLYFSTVFKKIIGRSPSEYRQAVKPKT